MYTNEKLEARLEWRRFKHLVRSVWSEVLLGFIAGAGIVWLLTRLYIP